ncbi:MAG: YggS family pyridoxal phosphate-dependent enzyme [Geothrix sp.]|uniref:YggS family pyridoxal phosphate-dependent enzyme n=1 Tax=Geothrix sp. TaxID=1962974 RepID=UPI0017C00B4C|nr:YggS family pyridoxal phosphate-dependent enzyme [Geothrix sp.]NWJ40154.1 YggS family pyridoxal phosphate-dependent enzyme [Geothrix sp.]WIL21837.1 MAG: YggS family pyridoxal phosphate-dependent enzyme [Geothrix sp.]
MSLPQRIEGLRARIQRACEAAGRNPATIELLPVSKKQPLSLIREAAAQGFTRFGENYVQEGADKAAALPELSFVLLGPLQRNKAKAALRHFAEIQSLDRPELAERLRRLAEELGVVRPVWIQVDLWDEATKLGGCTGADLPELLEALGDDARLPLRGLMAIPPPEDEAAFVQMAALRDRLQQDLGRPLRLSMGMSDDLEAAIAAGTDQIRIGTAFFGERTR